MTKTFKRANDAYEYYHDKIIREGVNFGDTKALFNVGFYLENPSSRQAAISIYDGKEHNEYATDTPCTYAIQFTIMHGRLDMCVTMRSNDLWYGFCNDQYQFSKLQEMISKRLNIETGVYYHFAHNMHLYNDKI